MTIENDFCDECQCPIGLGCCGGCIAVSCCDLDNGQAEADCCQHCGKDRYDFSDMGCGYCDARSPEWGTML